MPGPVLLLQAMVRDHTAHNPDSGANEPVVTRRCDCVREVRYIMAFGI